MKNIYNKLILKKSNGISNLLIKLLLVIYLLSFSWIGFIWNTYADKETWSWITVKVTEKIPWADCDEITKTNDSDIQMYSCNVQKWFSSITKMMWAIIKYFTYIAALGWVLFIVINGILFSMGWAEPSMKDDAKKRIIWTLTWLILLLLSWVILNMIAPWVYK